MFEDLRVFLREIEGLGDAPEEDVVGLLLGGAGALETGKALELAAQTADLRQQLAAVIEALPGDTELEVLHQLSSTGGIEGLVL